MQAFNHESRCQEQFDEINARLEKCSLRATFFSSLVNPSTRFVNSLVYTGVGIAGALSAIGGGISVGQLSSFLSYAISIRSPSTRSPAWSRSFRTRWPAPPGIFELIDEKPQVPDREDAKELHDVKGYVDLEHVYFSYDPKQKLIEDFNLSVKPGQRVAIVGPTGCGKTTLINLLMRFYDADSGRILVDGEDVMGVTRKSLRSNYGMVLQDTWLRNGTIRENIVMGKPDATEQEIREAAKASHADSFIRRLPTDTTR